MRMDDAVIDLHRFLATFNTMEIEYIIGNNTIMLVLRSPLKDRQQSIRAVLAWSQYMKNGGLPIRGSSTYIIHLKADFEGYLMV